MDDMYILYTNTYIRVCIYAFTIFNNLMKIPIIPHLIQEFNQRPTISII